MAQNSTTIYVVDDDEPVRQGLGLLFKASGYQTKLFASAGAFLDIAQDICNTPGCILLDQRMPGMTGLELQNHLAELNVRLPIIFLSGHATVPTAVQAIQDGAIDFMEKPFDSDALLEKVAAAVQRFRESLETETATQARLDSLTKREREVLEHIIAGKPNKIIAQELGISERTVELHRAHVMHKFEARNVAQLMQMLQPAKSP